ncbi:beta-mannosidase [Flavobacterium psychraquaticum]|uniref:beta-mannosidase n=1 Tax=Flavobacterium psychraquaticum TaxID=3103958 RepID=UPI002ACDB8F3|nr:glycoside hydrolase family 2 protein [Flavobacterium sp. LB-N7T]
MFRNLVLICSFLFSCLVTAQTSHRNLSTENWTFNKQNDSQKYKATIPGTVHTDLFQNKVIPDPFFGANEKELQWIENENWEYETNFSLTPSEFKNQNIYLEFDGLDTYATVYLNGNIILEANNMFRKWTVSVKSNLKKENNHLKIVFHSAVQKGKDEAKKISYTLPEKERVFVRKAQYQFGWDWGPRFVTAGIWQNVQLKFWNAAKIDNVRYDQKLLNKKKALLDIIVTIDVQKADKYQIDFGEKAYNFNLKKGINTVKIPVVFKNPIFWWSNGLGVPHQYVFQFELRNNDIKLEQRELKIGLRTIELIQQKDDKGTGFAFKLNGKMVYMKGANYIPPNSFLPRVKDSIYNLLIENARKANMNMLRVWGGGVYPDEAFYDACDSAGILVWQDFMFACAMYPGDKEFVENVKQEVIYQVNRLQNHPSLAIWCGNNENDEGWHNWGWQKQYNYKKADSTQIWSDYKKVFHEVIPNTLDSLVSKEKNMYWSSSPSIGWGRKESMTQGDSHYWGVWWGKEPFEIYKTKVPRFMSEYGFQGMPNIETLKKVVDETDLNFNSEALKNHQKHPIGNETIREYMERDFQIPNKFKDYVYVSQLLQAEGMKTAMEAHRLAKPYNMGTLYWQFNDCWPVTSWSSVDYFGNWKAFHYQAKRSFENILLSVNEENESYKVYLVNDNFEKYSDKLTLELLSFDGKLLWNSAGNIDVAENSSSIVFEIPKTDFSKFDLHQAVLNVHFKNESSNYFFVKPKDLKLTKPEIKIKTIDEFTLEISTNVLAKNVFLTSENEVFFEENYFDLLPNQKRIIKLSKSIKNIKVKSLFDTTK